MRKPIILLAFIFLFSVGVFAQTKPDYSGEWALDVSKSKLPDAMRNIESMTIKATQNETELKIETETKRASAEGVAPRVDLGSAPSTYALNGKETTTETETQMGKVPVKLKANFEKDGKLKLNSTRTFKTQGGQIDIVTKDIWELSDGGKALKISRTLTTPRGETKAEMMFTKK